MIDTGNGLARDTCNLVNVMSMHFADPSSHANKAWFHRVRDFEQDRFNSNPQFCQALHSSNYINTAVGILETLHDSDLNMICNRTPSTCVVDHDSLGTVDFSVKMFPTKNIQGLSLWGLPLFWTSSPFRNKSLTRGWARQINALG